MEYNRKKQLTQSAAFLQAHLHLSNDFLEHLIRIGVLNREEVITIQKDQTTSGKVLELICMLKRKDTRTFLRFIEALEEHDCYIVAQVLQNAEPGDVVEVDKRTMHVLENHLPDVPIRTLQNIAAYLLPCEVYHDDINSLQDKITSLQQTLADAMKPGGGLGGRQSSQGSSDGSSTGRSGVATPATSSAAWDVPQWDVPSQADELRQVLRQKDEIIQRKDAEYAKLRKILSDTQNDMQGVLDLNNQYLSIISQLNSMASMPTGVRHGGGGEQHADYMELEGQVEQAHLRIEELTTECKHIQEKMDSKQLELERALKREKKYKEMLGLDLEADEIDVMEKIQKLMADGKMQKDEVDKIRKELSKAKTSRLTLEERVSTLGREKEKIEFHMRQQELTIKKMNRQKTANEVIQKSQFMLNLAGNDPRKSAQLKLPSIERPPSSISLASKASKNSSQFCMFCRAEFTPQKSQTCRCHFRPIRGGKYICCRDDCHRSAGCLQLPHFYIEITFDKKIFLTDGARYMELT